MALALFVAVTLGSCGGAAATDVERTPIVPVDPLTRLFTSERIALARMQIEARVRRNYAVIGGDCSRDAGIEAVFEVGVIAETWTAIRQGSLVLNEDDKRTTRAFIYEYAIGMGDAALQQNCLTVAMSYYQYVLRYPELDFSTRRLADEGMQTVVTRRNRILARVRNDLDANLARWLGDGRCNSPALAHALTENWRLALGFRGEPGGDVVLILLEGARDLARQARRLGCKRAATEAYTIVADTAAQAAESPEASEISALRSEARAALAELRAPAQTRR